MDRFVSLSEGDTVHGHDTIRQIQMQMASFAHGTRVTIVDQMSAEEERTFVTRTERLQALEYLVHLPVHIAQLHFGFYIERRTLLFGGYMGGHVGLEPPLELRQILTMHTETGSKLMSSEVGQQVPTGVDGGIYIEITDRTGTSADDIVVSGRQYDRRTVIGLGQTTRGDTHDTLMPIGREDHGGVFSRIHRIFC